MQPEAVRGFIDRLEGAFREGDPLVDGKGAEAENVRRIQDQYRAIARGDFAAVLDLLHEEVDFEISGPPGVPFVGRWRGRDEVAAAVRGNFAMVEDQWPEVRAVIAQGDTVVIVAHEHGRFRADEGGNGTDYALHWVQVFTFRDEKVARFHEIIDGYAIGLPAAQRRI
ncbi:MAG TPA: nuclear transport factor 2 family protein [Isosphaeraceae bacterium]|jgi:hypothetical protein|nr:nuclear transport factor 2 family protein [Isosphaeraceae bacterium]